MNGSIVNLSGKPVQASPSLREIADKSGYNKATVSKVLNGKYDGKADTRDLILAAKAELEAEMTATSAESPAPQAVPVTPDAFTTDAQTVLRSLIEDTRIYHEISVLCGASGMGKTHAAEGVAEELGDTALYLRLRERMPYGGILDALLAKLGTTAHGAVHSREAELVSAMAAKGIELAILDEADHLVEGSDSSLRGKLGLIRHIWQEGAGPGVVLLGLPVLGAELQKRSDTYLWRRISLNVTLPAPGNEDLAGFWRTLSGTSADAPGMKGLLALAGKRGGFGLLRQIHRRIQSGLTPAQVLGLYQFQGKSL